MADIESYPDSRRVKDAIQTDIKGDLTELNSEVAALASGSGILVSSGDSTIGYLDGKAVAGNGVTLTKGNAGGNETLTWRVEISVVANAAALGTGTVDGQARITVDDGNFYTWDNTNGKWRIRSGNIYSSGPSAVTYTIPTGCLIFDTTDVEMKRWNGTAWIDYADYTGFYNAYAVVSHTETTGTDGGSAAADTWNVRTINTIESDVDSILSVSSNEITLDAGTYDIAGWSVAYKCKSHQSALYNSTSGSYLILGGVGYSATLNSNAGMSHFKGRKVIAASQALKVHHYTNTAKSDNGLGKDAGSAQNNIFARVVFRKLR